MTSDYQRCSRCGTLRPIAAMELRRQPPDSAELPMCKNKDWCDTARAGRSGPRADIPRVGQNTDTHHTNGVPKP